MGALGSLSKSVTSFWLDASEITLLICGLVLVIGIVGEYAKSERWLAYRRAFEILVTVGVAGELLADGGIFLFSRHLQTISDREIAELNTELANTQLGTAKLRLEVALQEKSTAEANERANEANEKAEQERLARLKIEEKLAWRSLDPQRRDQLVAALKQDPNRVRIELVNDPEASNLANILEQVLHDAGWTISSRQVGIITHTLGLMVLAQTDDPRPPGANTLLMSLMAAGLPVKPLLYVAPSLAPNDFVLSIGHKE